MRQCSYSVAKCTISTTIQNEWYSPKAKGKEPVPRIVFPAATNAEGRLFFFGGYDPKANKTLDDLNMLDTINLK
jgi:hypothetical protein